MYSLDDFLCDNITPEIRLVTKPMDFKSIEITCASVQELPVEDFIKENELVLSTALGCHENTSNFYCLIQEASNSHAAAMLLTFQDESYEIPGAVLDFADTVNLPLFIIPWEYRFSEIQAAVNQRIQEKNQEIYQSVRAALLKLYYESKPLNQAADVVADFLDVQIVVEDKQHHPQGVSKDLRDSNIPDDCCEELEISLSSMCLGYLRVYASQKSSEISIERDLLEQFICFPLSLWFNRKNIEDFVIMRLKNDFVWNLANQNYDSLEEMARQGLQLKFDLNRPYTCMILQIITAVRSESSSAHPSKEAEKISAIETLLLETGRRMNLKIMMADRSLQFIIFLENRDCPVQDVERFQDTVEEQLRKTHPLDKFFWGVSDISVKQANFGRLYQNAALALQYCMNANQQRYRFTFQDTKETQIVSVLSDSDIIKHAAEECLQQLVEYDKHSDMDLMGTLTTYIKCNYNTSLAARELNIHRQSLLYRLEKIESLTELSLSDHKSLFLLEIYSRLFRNY